MKKITQKLAYGLLLVIGLTTNSFAQPQTYTYYFNNDFTESSGNGPALTQICTGQFVTDSFPSLNTTRKVYHFDNNCGFSFNDVGGFLVSGNYTIELYFKMQDLGVWKRVVDFKDRSSDYGCYVFNGQMNFYNFVTSGAAPFQEDVFSHYVITRNAATKKVTLYGNGNQCASFIDSNDDAVYDITNKKLNFFQDDLVLGGEASEGSIAILKIHNYTKDSIAVTNSYNDLPSILTGINTMNISSISPNIYPNPTNSNINVEARINIIVKIVNVLGETIATQNLQKGNNTIDVHALSNGVYFIQNIKGGKSVKFIKE